MAIPHSQRSSLFLEDYETMNEEGTGLYSAFSHRVKDFIKEYNLQNKKTVELEYILTGVITGIMAEMRLSQNMEIKKEKKNSNTP